MKIHLIAVCTFLSLLACSKNDAPIEPTTIPEVVKTTKSYSLSQIDSSDFHIYVGTDTGAIDKAKSPDSKSYWHLYIKEKILDLLSDSLIVSDSTMLGFKGGKVSQTYLYKIKNDTFYWSTNGWDADKFSKVGTLIDKKITIFYPAYYLNTDLGFMFSPLSFRSWGVIQESDIFTNENFYHSKHEMNNAKDIASWINVKVNYSVK